MNKTVDFGHLSIVFTNFITFLTARKHCTLTLLPFYGTYDSPSRVCKERSDGIAIVRTFQSPLHLSKPQVRNRITYDPSEEKACDGQKKRHHLTWCLFLAPLVGFEPTTLRLTAGCSAAELSRNIFGKFKLTKFPLCVLCKCLTLLLSFRWKPIRLPCRWAIEEYNVATTYPPGRSPCKYFRRAEA